MPVYGFLTFFARRSCVDKKPKNASWAGLKSGVGISVSSGGVEVEVSSVFSGLKASLSSVFVSKLCKNWNIPNGSTEKILQIINFSRKIAKRAAFLFALIAILIYNRVCDNSRSICPFT